MEAREIRDRARATLRGAGITAAEKLGRLTGGGLAKIVSRLLGGAEDQAEEPGYVSSLAQLAGAEAAAAAAESPELQKTGERHVADQISEVIQAIRTETTPLLREIADKINPDHREVYNQIRGRLRKPEDPILKKLAVGFVSRLLTFGVQATSYISAVFVGGFTDENERVENQGSFDRIWTGILKRILPNRAAPAPVASPSTALATS